MSQAEYRTRRADRRDASAIASAHLDSIRQIGPTFYSRDIVETWASGITPDGYVGAMEGGEVFFVATGKLDGEPVVLGFSSHRVDDAQDGVSVYVRGAAARRGIGTALLRLAEAAAVAHGAASIQIQASLAGVAFYKSNGFEEVHRGEALLMTGKTMPCVFMRKEFRLALAIAFVCLASQPRTYAAEQPPGTGTPSAVRQMGFERLTLRDAVTQEAGRLVSSQQAGTAAPAPSAPANRTWMQRHPAAFGALVGAGAGAVSSIPRWNELYCAGGGDEDCLFHGAAGVAVGAGIGAGIGALVGMLVGPP
jgi:GNAT superfamily N-acetyltransferase